MSHVTGVSVVTPHVSFFHLFFPFRSSPSITDVSAGMNGTLISNSKSFMNTHSSPPVCRDGGGPITNQSTLFQYMTAPKHKFTHVAHSSLMVCSLFPQCQVLERTQHLPRSLHRHMPRTATPHTLLRFLLDSQDVLHHQRRRRARARAILQARTNTL